ncbi:uncharacterized protein LOC124453917 [Xenia sp. Carnegie-2017]|uniref:uncharacterized protein LOC124453917 n=1 Tax=Xenia sp. Carnegie-2017 TaxID=2897299 RepID=UPI001F039F70|nr:uncharacterized protein LOC124453917 [Xenia sp. Carnegie-2017]
MNIVCPSEASVNTWRSRPLYTDSLYENLWHVNKAGYDKCEVNDGGKLLLVCNNPSYVKKLQLGFHPRYSAKEPRFIPGKHYYFISTSVGYPEDLQTRKTSGPDGHCLTNHMKLHIYVCNPKVETCIWEPPICEPPKEIQYRMEMINGVLQRPRLPSPPTTESTSSITKLKKITITTGATSEVLPPQTLQYREECKDEGKDNLGY